MPAVYVLNKIDQISVEELDIISRLPHCVPISATHGWNLDELIDQVWDECKMIRIYTKPKGQIPDYTAPVRRASPPSLPPSPPPLLMKMAGRWSC